MKLPQFPTLCVCVHACVHACVLAFSVCDTIITQPFSTLMTPEDSHLLSVHAML